MARLNAWLLLTILITLTLACLSFADDHKMREHNIHEWFPNWWFPEMQPPATLDDPAWDRTAAGWQTRTKPQNGWMGLLIENDDKYNEECGKIWREVITEACHDMWEWTCTRVGRNRTTAAMTFIVNHIVPVHPYGQSAPFLHWKRGNPYLACRVQSIEAAIRLASRQTINSVDIRDRSRYCNDHGCVFWKCQAAGICPR